MKWIKERLVMGMLMSIPLVIAGLITNFIIFPFITGASNIGKLLIDTGIWATLLGILIILTVLLAMGIVGHILSLEKRANLLRRKIPNPRLINALSFIKKVRKGGAAFPEVVFEFSPGVWKKAILMTDARFRSEIDRDLFSVWEPRPLSPGGEIYYLEKGKFFKTGRPGYALIKEISFSYGVTPVE